MDHLILNALLILFLFIAFTAQVLKVCRTPGPTACSRKKMLHLDKVHVFEKLVKGEKILWLDQDSL